MSAHVTIASHEVAITAVDIVRRCLSAAPVSKTDAVRLFADVLDMLSRMHLADAEDTKSGAEDERQTAPAAAPDGGSWVPASLIVLPARAVVGGGVGHGMAADDIVTPVDGTMRLVAARRGPP